MSNTTPSTAAQRQAENDAKDGIVIIATRVIRGHRIDLKHSPRHPKLVYIAVDGVTVTFKSRTSDDIEACVHRLINARIRKVSLPGLGFSLWTAGVGSHFDSMPVGPRRAAKVEQWDCSFEHTNRNAVHVKLAGPAKAAIPAPFTLWARGTLSTSAVSTSAELDTRIAQWEVSEGYNFAYVVPVHVKLVRRYRLSLVSVRKVQDDAAGPFNWTGLTAAALIEADRMTLEHAVTQYRADISHTETIEELREMGFDGDFDEIGMDGVDALLAWIDSMVALYRTEVIVRLANRKANAEALR